MPKLPSALGTILAPFMPVKLRAAVYVRKSDKKDEGRTKSREEQLAFCTTICAHYGLEISEERIYEEELGQKGQWFFDDSTGRYPAPYRPQLTRLVRDIKAGLVDVVVIWRSDRLFRDSGVADAIAQVLREHNTRLICGTREIDVTSSSGLYQYSTEAANNRRWRDQTSENIKRDHQFKAELGMFTRDPSCLGFRSKGRKSQDVIFMRDELALALRVFQLFVHGEDGLGPMGTNGIASHLMDQGVIWPKGTKGHRAKGEAKIHESQVRTLLRNPMYIARWRHDGAVYDCDKLLVPVLDENGEPTGERRTAVPVKLFEDAQAKLELAQRPGKRSLGGSHLTTGMAVCGRCGRPLQVQQSHGRVEKGPRKGECREPVLKLVCKHRRGDRPCPGGSAFGLQEEVLDAWVLSELAPILVSEMKAIRASAGRALDQENLCILQRKLAEVRKRETTQLAQLVGVLDAEQVSSVAAQFRAERERLGREIRTLSDRIENAERVMPDLSPEALAAQPVTAIKDALSRAIAWIAIGKAGTGIVVHTRWGSYIGAPYRKGDPGQGEVASKTYIGAAAPADVLSCIGWVPEPEEFNLGRRDALGKLAVGLSDDELAPGLLVREDVDAEDGLIEVTCDGDSE